MSSALCIHGKFGKYGKTRVWKTLLETMGFLYKEKEIWETESKKQSVKIGVDKRVNKCIERRIKKIVIRTITFILMIAVITAFVINPIMNSIFFNPYEMNDNEEQKMLSVMRNYVETVFPYREVASLEVEKKGFGRYEIAMQIVDTAQTKINIGKANVWVEMNRGKYHSMKDADSVMTISVGRFNCIYENQEQMISQIEELPKSAKLFLSVSDTQPKSIKELRSLPVEVRWMQVYQPNVEFQGGLSNSPMILYSENDRREEMSEQELLEVYCGNLKSMIDYPEVWEGFGELNSGDGKIYTEPKKMLKETYEDAKKLTELKSENYCVVGNRDEILTFLQENSLDSIFVENVTLW